MWEPVGPLPATVYWRRRAVAVASTVAVVLLLVLSIVAIVSPRDDEPTVRAGRAAMTATEQPSASPVPSSAPALPGDPAPSSGQAPPTDPAVVGPTVPAPASAPPASAPPGVVTPVASSVPAPGVTTPGVPGSTTPGAPATTSEELRPDETPRQSVAAATPVPVPATGPVPCTDAMLAVGAEIDSPQHKVGDRPLLRLTITNSSAQPCVRDLDSARQEIVVWNGDQTAKLWSSNDCSNVASADLRTLVPGQPVAFAVTWAGRTSTPGCAKARTVVPAGAYRVLTRLDGVISPPTPFLIS